jgi:hypothetical protein
MVMTADRFHHDERITMPRHVKRLATGAVTVAAMAAGGAALGNAATSHSSAATTTTTSAPSMPPHGFAAHEDAEKPVTGDAATKAKAAAVESVGSGTAGEVTTDFTGDGYEVAVTKADGSTVEVHLDSSFTVRQGGPGGFGR